MIAFGEELANGFARRPPVMLGGDRSTCPVALYDLGGEGPPLLGVHATGFCARVLEPFANWAAGFRVYAIDLRGHGRARCNLGSDFSWDAFSNDVLVAAEYLAGQGQHVYGFGHSCGGAAVLSAELARPNTFAAIYCYEPTVVLSQGVETHAERLATTALRRTRRFASRQAAYENFASKAPMNTFDPEALAGYVEGGFHDAGDDIELACDPEDEAAVYRSVPTPLAWDEIGQISVPVALGCGTQSNSFTPAVTAAIAARLKCHAEAFPGLGHFGPMQAPRVVAAKVASWFSAHL